MPKSRDPVPEVGVNNQDTVCNFLLSLTENKSDHIATHCAHIYLIGDHAFKIKRDVKYNYLDMSTLAKRQVLCKRELELNRSVLPDIYLSLVPITREQNGALKIDGRGDTIEWALKMKRFAQERVLENIALADGLTPALAKSIGLSVAEYHESLPSLAVTDGYARIREVYDELVEAFESLKSTFNASSLVNFKYLGARALRDCHENLDKRAREGHIKRCHGDLHLRNLLMTERGPVPFDALEFDERMATTDELYDLAFLLMDLGHRGLQAQTNAVLNEYLLHRQLEQCEGLRSLPLFLYCRAGIKAMTTAQAAHLSPQNAPNLEQEARHYLDEANQYLEESSPRLIAIGGLSGTGKSSVASKLATRICNSPGAIILRSDAERKIMAGISETEHLPDAHYTADNATRNYEHLLKKAEIALKASATVVIDAVFQDEDIRSRTGELANRLGIKFSGCWLEASTDVLSTRIQQRKNDASDADVQVLHKQLLKAPGYIDWAHIDASRSLDDTVNAVLISID